MKFILKHKVLFYILQFTWGLLMNLVGLTVSLAMLISGHKPRKFGNCWYFIVGKCWGGCNMGVCFLTDQLDDPDIKKHESGHSLQNIIWGPLFIFVIGIPSSLRYLYREFKYYRKGKEPKTDYDAIWFEGQATRFGYKYFDF